MPKEKRRITEEKTEIATFVVQVKHRENATWQGDVLWAEENRTLSFRSAMELLRMIDSVVGAEGESLAAQEEDEPAQSPAQQEE